MMKVTSFQRIRPHLNDAMFTNTLHIRDFIAAAFRVRCRRVGITIPSIECSHVAHHWRGC